MGNGVKGALIIVAVAFVVDVIVSMIQFLVNMFGKLSEAQQGIAGAFGMILLVALLFTVVVAALARRKV